MTAGENARPRAHPRGFFISALPVPALVATADLEAALRKTNALLMSMPEAPNAPREGIKDLWNVWTDACNISKAALTRHSTPKQEAAK